ncbi:hypothetical protein DFP72DRAFT_1142436 [Ephemerocybe angulata]|uniref:Uncharacterized protein n=1 Tax=Ephemerocybe angulata TaxID=980116 RepID=A0A8H6HM86_9AGAR|nr:hypothetical protein DFP72DRAFT_1142436 [Tulosesus angulatus]
MAHERIGAGGYLRQADVKTKVKDIKSGRGCNSMLTRQKMHFDRTVQGMFFAAALSCPVLVPVPVARGLDFVAGPYDCDYRAWVPQSPGVDCASRVQLGHIDGCHLFSVDVPSTSDALTMEHVTFVLFYVPQCYAASMGLPANKAFAQLPLQIVRGDVLVLKVDTTYTVHDIRMDYYSLLSECLPTFIKEIPPHGRDRRGCSAARHFFAVKKKPALRNCVGDEAPAQPRLRRSLRLINAKRENGVRAGLLLHGTLGIPAQLQSFQQFDTLDWAPKRR